LLHRTSSNFRRHSATTALRGLRISPKNIGAHSFWGRPTPAAVDDRVDCCDLIVLDVEGFELAALRGAGQHRAYSPVVMIEDRGWGRKLVRQNMQMVARTGLCSSRKGEPGRHFSGHDVKGDAVELRWNARDLLVAGRRQRHLPGPDRGGASRRMLGVFAKWLAAEFDRYTFEPAGIVSLLVERPDRTSSRCRRRSGAARAHGRTVCELPAGRPCSTPG
jgi:hypothetical protein